jgi:hypothetical protein
LHKKDHPPVKSTIICVAEHHLVLSKLKAPRKKIGKAVRSSFVTAATSIGQGGSSGGTMVLPKKGLHIFKVWSKEGGPMDNWRACMIRGQARDLVVITLYLKDGAGMSPHQPCKARPSPWFVEVNQSSLDHTRRFQHGSGNLRSRRLSRSDRRLGDHGRSRSLHLHDRERLLARLCNCTERHS